MGVAKNPLRLPLQNVSLRRYFNLGVARLRSFFPSVGIGLAALTVVPEIRAGRVRPSVPGGAFGREGFSLAWPIWREPATLSSIRSLLGHPKLRESNALEHLGIDHVVAAKRISVGKFMNFTRARPVEKS